MSMSAEEVVRAMVEGKPLPEETLYNLCGRKYENCWPEIIEVRHDEGLLRGINNAIDYNNKDINVFESELTKFKYLYSKNDKGALTFDEINALSESVFNTELSKENIADYLNQDGVYEYEINYGNPKYCIKVVNEKNGDNIKTYVSRLREENGEFIFDAITDEHEWELVRTEIEILKICQHPNIIALYDVFENVDYFYIIKISKIR